MTYSVLKTTTEEDAMWEELRQMAGQALERGAGWLRHAAFIDGLFQLSEAEALARLRDTVHGMSPQDFAQFGEVLNTLLAQAQNAYQQAREARENEWGSSVEDRMARMMAGIQSGEGPGQAIQAAQARVQDLQAIAEYARQFRGELNDGQASATPMPPTGLHTAHAESAHSAREQDAGQNAIQAIQAMVASGRLPENLAGFMQQLAGLTPDQIQAMQGDLVEMGAGQAPSPPLDIREHYHPSDGCFRLLWPLGLMPALPLKFDELDRETQFHVLWGEWSRRELEGMLLLGRGDTGGARSTFEECLGRACQLEVNELIARSYEDLMRVAQKNGDLAEERRHLEAALRARGP